MFRSFFMAGYECAIGYNRHGQWIDQIHATQHDVWVRDDYRRLREVGIRTAREGVRWPLVDRGGRYDFSSLDPFLDAASEHGIELVLDLFHFGYPDGLDLFADEFPARFARYAAAVARHVSRKSDAQCWFTPINEPSYFAWAAGESGLFAPHQNGRGPELKIALARAAIDAIDAIRAELPSARIVSVDALCQVVPASADPWARADAESFNEGAVFEAWDMIAGRLHPELGGSPDHLGVVGVNYYWTNQWQLGTANGALAGSDPRRAKLRELVRRVWRRYGVDVAITETSHVGDERAPWLREVAVECEALLRDGVPLRGICLYPILGMPEWHARDEWARMGVWDLVPRGPTLARVACPDVLEALSEAQRLVIEISAAPREGARAPGRSSPRERRRAARPATRAASRTRA